MGELEPLIALRAEPFPHLAVASLMPIAYPRAKNPVVDAGAIVIDLGGNCGVRQLTLRLACSAQSTAGSS
jgi:hypothetical protein